jgi:hypothetical protein
MSALVQSGAASGTTSVVERHKASWRHGLRGWEARDEPATRPPRSGDVGWAGGVASVARRSKESREGRNGLDPVV